jgi:uridine kinase
MDKLIIHISGASGSGKTTLGNKLKEKFGNKIIVKDLDNLRDEHIKKTYDTSKGWSVDEVKYQKFIDDFIKKQKKQLFLLD